MSTLISLLDLYIAAGERAGSRDLVPDYLNVGLPVNCKV
jgi:hypothetical protein